MTVRPVDAPTPPRRILLVAGEASGDAHGADLVRALTTDAPGLDVFGVGGPALRAAGMRILVETEHVAGMALFEAADKLGAIVRTYRRLSRLLRRDPPDLVVLIDFPEFNLRLAKVAKRAHVPVFYFVSPQVWAWRRRRVHTIAKRVDQLAAVFPFEPDFYAAHGCAAEFVGHPLVDRVRPSRPRDETRRRYGLAADRKTVALLPGSRSQEVRALLGPMLRAAAELGDTYQFVLAAAPTLDAAELRAQIADAPVSFRVVENDTYDVVHAADLALVASGTATLEAALLERPMVIVYRLAPLTYALARLFVRVPFIGMPNLIAGRQVVPELVQGDVTPARIAAEARQLLTDARAYSVARHGLREVRGKLGAPGAAARAARMILDLLHEG